MRIQNRRRTVAITEAINFAEFAAPLLQHFANLLTSGETTGSPIAQFECAIFTVVGVKRGNAPNRGCGNFKFARQSLRGFGLRQTMFIDIFPDTIKWGDFPAMRLPKSETPGQVLI